MAFEIRHFVEQRRAIRPPVEKHCRKILLVKRDLIHQSADDARHVRDLANAIAKLVGQADAQLGICSIFLHDHIDAAGRIEIDEMPLETFRNSHQRHHRRHGDTQAANREQRAQFDDDRRSSK